MENKKKFDLVDHPILVSLVVALFCGLLMKIFVVDTITLNAVTKTPKAYYKGEDLIISIPVVNKGFSRKSFKINNIYLNGYPENINVEYSNSVKGRSYVFADVVIKEKEYNKTKNNCRDNKRVVFDINIGDKKITESSYCSLP